MSLKSIDEYLQEIAAAQRKFEADFGLRLEDLGATIEEEVESVLQVVLEDKGYRLLGETYILALDDKVNLFMELGAPTGETVWAVVDVNVRLNPDQVRAWAQQMKSAGWQERLMVEGVAGPYLVYAYGIRIAPGTAQAAEEQGIGLATGRGERVSPKELIRSPTG
jgi:hypothetical protein